MRRLDRTPVADEEEPYSASVFNDSSPSNAVSARKLSKPSINFDDVMLDRGQMKRPHSALDIFLSVAGHTLLVVIFILMPLLYTNSMDLSKFQDTILVAPPPPPPPPPPPSRIAPSHPVFHLRQAELYAPRTIPKQIAQIKDAPAPSQPAISGVEGGVPGGVVGGQLGGVLGGILASGNHQFVPPPPPNPTAHHGPYRVGGKVQAPRQIKQVQPMYPILAKQARVSGDVKIDCVIDEQGNVVQMSVVSGNPLLANAALNAVEQWKYQPTLLNGQPIAVNMVVTVTFALGS